MSPTRTTILTIGQIASRLNEPLHRVEYLIKSRGVRPITVAGNARIFDEDAVKSIATALRYIDAKREGGAQCRP